MQADWEVEKAVRSIVGLKRAILDYVACECRSGKEGRQWERE